VSIDDNSFFVLLGRGDGTFQSLPRMFVNEVTDVIAADFNGDGVPDLAACTFQDGMVYIILSDGRGGFFAPVPYNANSARYSLTTRTARGIR
jgi:hypothetical protein